MIQNKLGVKGDRILGRFLMKYVTEESDDTKSLKVIDTKNENRPFQAKFFSDK